MVSCLRRAPVFGMLVVAFVLSGCIAADEAPDASLSEDGADGIDTTVVGEDATSLDAIEWVLTETPVLLDGASPPGVWVCALSPAVGQCEILNTQETDYSWELEYPGRLIGWDLVVTSAPVTPENPGMRLNIGVGSPDNSTWYNVEGASPVRSAEDDLDREPGTLLRLSSYTMPDADVQGDLWVDPIPQDFRIEGVLYSMVSQQ